MLSDSPLLVIRSSVLEERIPSIEIQHGLPIHRVSDTIVGVLGGGQLGRMLLRAASKMAIKVVSLDPFDNCPASSFSHQHVIGSFNVGETVGEFAKRCGVLTVEIEYVDAVTLEKLEQEGVDHLIVNLKLLQ